MDGLNINGMVQGLLENPQMMQSIMGLLGNLKESPPSAEKNVSDTEDVKEQNNSSENSERDMSSLLSLLGNTSSNKENSKEGRETNNRPCPSDRKALLLALKPFLGKERRDKIDFILNVLSLLDVAESLGFTNFKI